MSERRFVICDATEAVSTNKSINAIQSITESELKRRVHDIRTIMYYNDDRAIDILLHGEGKEEPETDYFGYPMPKEQPADDEWEAWLEEMPYLMVEDVWSRDNWKNWFRKMPRGK